MHGAIKLRHIRAFLDIATNGVLSDVARRTGITQPALSRTLAELETLLGQKLFARQGRSLILNAAGRLFLPYAQTAVQTLESGAAALRPGTHGTLRVGILPTVATRFFPELLRRFLRLHPNMTVAVETGPHFHLMQMLRGGQIDLMFGRLPAASDMAGLGFQHLYESGIVLVADAHHPMAGRPAPQVLGRCPVILPPQSALIRPPVQDYLTSIGLSGLRPVVETVSLALGRGLCIGSQMVWFISQEVVIDDLDRGILTRFPLTAGFLSGIIGVTYRQAGQGQVADDALIGLARQLADEPPPNG